jgi:hypothetical protein
MITIPDGHINAELLKTLVIDGWKIDSGPWGNLNGDRSVIASKDVPEFNGYFVLHFVDRDYVGTRITTRDVSLNGWFKDHSFSSRERSFNPDFSQGYSLESLKRNIGYCDFSGDYVGYEKLVSVGFANAVAPQYLDAARKKWEFEDWTK